MQPSSPRSILPSVFASSNCKNRLLSINLLRKTSLRVQPPYCNALYQISGSTRASSTSSTRPGAPPEQNSLITEKFLTQRSRTKCDNDEKTPQINPHNNLPTSHLNPLPDDYRQTTFADRCTLTLYAGSGGNGCISFLRDLHFGGDAQGPPNGGNGGDGGNVYITAAHGETSLHKIAHRRIVRAGRGKAGAGKSKDGQRGADYVITVPVGTVVREVWRDDPVSEEIVEARERRRQRRVERKHRAEEAVAEALKKMENEADRVDEEREKAERRQRRRIFMEENELEDQKEEQVEPEELLTRAQVAQRARQEQLEKDWQEYDYPHYDKWVFYPGLSTSERFSMQLPKLPKRERLFEQPEGPLMLDLSRPPKRPLLIAAGGLGGLGNTYFHNYRTDRPMIATKGEPGVSMKITLELKLLADVGLVGLPNAGKSTLLRSLTNSRARVGNWAFTTLQPNIGTVVLDNYRGRVTPLPKPQKSEYFQVALENGEPEPRARFTIADIPGLIEGAHLDRGLGIDFLRHVERAGVLAFVIDLSAGKATDALDALWREVGLYAQLREEEERVNRMEKNNLSTNAWDEDPNNAAHTWRNSEFARLEASVIEGKPMDIAAKPWFVIATKADMKDTQDNFHELKYYVDGISRGDFPHPSKAANGWTAKCAAIPVSAINGHGMDRIVHWVAGLLDCK